MDTRGKAIMELKKILLTAPVHQDADIFKEYLNSINHLKIPKNYILKKYFYLHNCSILKEFLASNEYEEILDNCIYEKYEHNFKNNNYTALQNMRTKALEKARKENYDYVFSVDSDILLHPNCLLFLLEDNADIVGMINWSRSKEGNKILPNCYDMDYWKWWNNTQSEIYQKGLTKRGIISSTVLLGKKIIENEKINYYSIDNVECSEWEDYALSLKAHVLIPDLKMFLDTRLPSRHLYKEKDYNRWMMEKKQYE